MPNFLKDFRGCLNTLPLLFLTAVVLAQPKDNSPYTRIGLGETITNSLSSAGFAGLSAAYNDPLHINLQNPAAYGWLKTATFEAGLYTKYSKLELGSETAQNWSGNLSHLALAFPIHNGLNDVMSKKQRKLHWGMSFALLPNSTVGYDIETTAINSGQDTTRNIYQGSGGTNKFLWGNAVNYKNFSAGANVGFMFGQIESTRQLDFLDLDNAYADIFKDNISVRGFIWSLGAQQQIVLEPEKKDQEVYTGKSLIIGAYGNSATNFDTRSTFLRMRYNPTTVHRDTLTFEEDQEGTGKLPAEITVGVMYQNPGKFRLGAEFYAGKWSKYENEAKPESLFDSRRVAVGAEYIPDISSYNKYLNRIRYRVGAYHRTDPRLNDLKQYAVTVGFGLPVILPRQQTSFVNLAFEFGKYDTANAIKETFVKMSLGFTLNDSSWFFKRKFG
ncbi:MAG: hypothetical protein K9J37_13805 [Saprospiraceae bacterium]|nr:hypothetical protein [Saprospiraceae bacterium]MCF8250985.1 hypothetical protein [Saprospiraceae bacterium]MCF8280314.1 hypothetical protein [Bacteroidales bacterium]MCF8312841.1 hypothetical protein [Saprospiraceae bacterium]MCF8441288.1 hypothetical protein [Saprospiraceae bacterium]